MSAKRKVQRSMLRAAGPDEQAFTTLLATWEAFRRLGFHRGALQAFFWQKEGLDVSRQVSGSAAGNRCIPCVIVTGPRLNKNPEDSEFASLTYRLDNHVILGDQAECDKRWRKWVIALVGDRQDIDPMLMERMYKKSPMSGAGVKRRLARLVAQAGIELPNADFLWSESSEKHR